MSFTIIAVLLLAPAPPLPKVGAQGGDPRRKTTPARTKATTPKRTQPKKARVARQSSAETEDGEEVDERTYWEMIRSSTDPEDFKAYLKDYPGGWFAGKARAILRALERGETATASLRPRPHPARPPGARYSVNIEYVSIPAGSFMMGSELNVTEQPLHEVTFREGFYMSKHEVTQGQWKVVMGSNPSGWNKGDNLNLPVETVTWDDAQEFIRRLNAQNDGFEYRLPSEAEWEYAARAGTTTEFAFGSSLSSEQANFDGRSPFGGAAPGIYREKTTPVGSFAPNAWGLYDMHGNVHEWVEDPWHPNYEGAPMDGSAWITGGDTKLRLLRGGGWNSFGKNCLSATRYRVVSTDADYNIGFRVVRVKRADVVTQ